MNKEIEAERAALAKLSADALAARAEKAKDGAAYLATGALVAAATVLAF